MTMYPKIPSLLIVVLVASGCSGGSSDSAATVTGDFVRVGGPAPGASVPLTGRIRFVSTSRTVTVKAGTDGKFVAHLPPGRYSVDGTSPQIQDGVAPCGGGLELTVAAGQTLQQRVVCDIR